MNFKEIAEHLDLSESRVRQLQKSGVFSKTETLDSARILYIRFLRKESQSLPRTPKAALETDEPPDLDLVEQKARLAYHDANLKELKEKELKHQLVSAEATAKTWAKILSATRAKILAVPIKAAETVAAETDAKKTRRFLESLIFEALDELANDEYPSIVADEFTSGD